MTYNRRRTRSKTTGFIEPSPLEQSFLQALKPLPKWRHLAQQCVMRGTASPSSPGGPINQESFLSNHDNNNNNNNKLPSYIALHSRIELEMMDHLCGTFMNRNLTLIFQYVQDFVNNNTNTFLGNVSGVFVAMSRKGASGTSGSGYPRFRSQIIENVQTMNRVIGNGSVPGEGLSIHIPSSPADSFAGGGDGRKTRQIPVFECGDRLLEEYYESQLEQPTIRYGSLLPSIINFDVAVEATAFVGVRASSWSNSVWTTRYYLGRGHTNYEYTRERGIVPIENGGLPPPHQNCDKLADPGRR